MAFNSSLASALASRKKFVDATSSITSVGEGTKQRDKPGTEFYSGNFVEKSSTGFTGLANQGATCYLNSFIQSLYMTPEFRRAAYEYVWDKEEPADTCIGLQLQKLFARLQISDKGAVTTSGLTKSFGWDSADVFTQQDVQEMFHVLFEAIEKTCTGSTLSNIVSTHYRGFNTDFVHCQKCKNHRGREDAYLDLGLTVEGTGSLKAALDAFVKTEILADKNAYNCAPCASKQTAEKGLRFSSFPYILSLQLQRFKMNWQFMRREKVNDEFYFPPSIDLAKWLPADKTVPPEGLNYELYAILIHTGGASAGHYFSYIKNFSDKKWYRFDDAAVTPLDQKDVDAMFFDEEAKIKQDGEAAAARALAAAAATPSSTSSSSDGGIPDAPAGVPDAPPPPPTTEKKVTFGTGSVLAGELRPKGRGGAPVVFIDPKKNAYMLIYRRVDPTRNITSIDSKDIPLAMQEEVKAENEIYAVQKKEFDRQRALTRIDFYWNNMKTRVEFNKEETTIAQATERAWRELKIGDGDAGVPLDRIRLRNYDTLKNTPGMPYAAPYIDTSTLISLLDFADNKPLLVETRAVDAEWTIWRPNQTAFQIVQLDTKTNEYRMGITVEAAEAGNVKELRQAVASALSIPIANTQLVFLGGDTPKVLNDDFKTIKDLRLVRGDTIHVERVESLTATPIVSRIIDKYELAVNCVPMRFNIPRTVIWNDEIKSLRTLTETRVSQRYAAKLLSDDEDEQRRRKEGDSEPRFGGMARLEQKRLKFSNDGALQDNMIEIELDIRRPLIDLKREIARIIGIPLDKFKLRNTPAGTELKDLTRGVVQYGLDGSIWVEEGTPLVEGQYLFKVYLEIPYEAKDEKRESKHDTPVATPSAAAASSSAVSDASSIPPPPPDVPDLTSSVPAAPPAAPSLVDAPSLGGAHETKAEVKHTDLVFLQDVVLEGKWSLKRVKEELAKLSRAPPVELMRVRERSAPPSTTLTAFYVDSKLLDQNAKGIRDGKLLVIQRTVVPETLTEDHVLVYVRQWHPVEFQLAAPLEMAFLRSLTHVDLKKQLASIAGIKSGDDVAIVKPMAWKLADLDNLPGLDWHEPSITKTSSLGGMPWRLGTGTQAVIVYKDKTLPERIIIPDELHDTSVKSTHRERGVKILSRAEIKERDEQKAKEAALLKKAEEEAREERVQQQLAAAVGVAATTTTTAVPVTPPASSTAS